MNKLTLILYGLLSGAAGGAMILYIAATLVKGFT